MTDDFRKYRPRDSGAIIPIDDDAFGDVSKIDIDISRIQGSPVVASETQVLQFKNAVDYVALHDSDIRQSIRQLSQEACGSTRAGKPFAGRKNNDLALMLSSKGNVVDLPNQSLPKALRKKASAQGEEITVGSRSGVVKQELGRGSYGVVVLLRPVDSGDAIAVKAQAPTDCLAWEYIVMRRLEERLSGIKLGPHPFPKPLSFVSLTDGSLLGMTAGSKNGTNLVDIVNFYNVGEGRPVPELIALHYTSRMLHHIEILHWRGNILHCDVKPDNWVLMGSNEAYDGCIEYVDGADLMLVDFGRAVDLASASPNAKEPLDVMFTGQATSEEMACISMRKNLGWSLDLDTFGICASAHVLLFGEHIEPECRSKKWKAKKTFRRYWQTQLWEEVFSTLLNLDEVSQTAMGSRPRALRQLRNKLEAYLSTKVKDLDSLLKHQCRNLPKRKTSTNKK